MSNIASKAPPSEPFITLPTRFGTFQVSLAEIDGVKVLVAATETIPETPLIRFQSACVFGEAFAASDCDCGVQMLAALDAIFQSGGVLTYAWEEGRGVGIASKIKAIAIQQRDGLSTVDAFLQLGHDPEPRDFAIHIAALKTVYAGKRVRLASNNPRKVEALEAAGYQIVERVKLEIPLTPERREYLVGKTSALGHYRDDNS